MIIPAARITYLGVIFDNLGDRARNVALFDCRDNAAAPIHRCYEARIRRLEADFIGVRSCSFCVPAGDKIVHHDARHVTG